MLQDNEGMKFTFRQECSYEGQPRGTVEITTDAVSLDEILPVFEQFLRGCGFVIDGQIDIVKEETE